MRYTLGQNQLRYIVYIYGISNTIDNIVLPDSFGFCELVARFVW